MSDKGGNMLEANKYYLFSFQISNDLENIFEANARLEEGKIVFEIKIVKATQEKLLEDFKKLEF